MDEAQAADRLAAVVQLGDPLDDVVHVALGVRAAGDREADEVERGPPPRAGAPVLRAEHDVADLAGAHADLLVQRDGQRPAGEALVGEVVAELAAVEVDRVAADRLEERHAGGREVVPDVRGGRDPVLQVLLVEDLVDPDRERLEVAAGEPAVRDEPLGEDEQGADPLGPLVGVDRDHPADVAERVLLHRHQGAVGEREHLAGDLAGRPVPVAGLSQLDEVGVLREARGVEQQRDAEAVADRARSPYVGHRDWLAAAGVVRDRDQHERHTPAAGLLDAALEGGRGRCSP